MNIRRHDFNSKWYGSAVGVIDDPSFFDLPDSRQAELLRPYVWAEFRCLLNTMPGTPLLAAKGFRQIDVQVPFKIGILSQASRDSIASLTAIDATSERFTIRSDDLAPFVYERFLQVRGATQAKVNERYALWAEDLVKRHPDLCIAIRYNGRVQGWFLSEPADGTTLELTLAMLRKDATISGMLLYEKGLDYYASLGYRLGRAAFSIQNTPVHNMYAALNAKFLPAIGYWLWEASSRTGA